MTQPDIEKPDPNPVSPGAGDGLRWHDIRRLELEGKGWTDTAQPFDRFPARAEALIPPNVWELSRHSAGMAVRFATAAPAFSVRWTLRFESLASHLMPASGVSGLDLIFSRRRGSGRHGGRNSSHGSRLHAHGRNPCPFFEATGLNGGRKSLIMPVPREIF